MNHKKITIGCVTVAMLFSFGILKPMEGEENKMEKKEEVKKINDKMTPLFPKEDKNLATFDKLDTLLLFENQEHLIEICTLQKAVLDHGMPTLKETGKFIKPVVDWGPLAVAGGWTLKNVLGGHLKNWTSYVVPSSIGVLSSLYHWKVKKPYYGDVVEKWDDETLKGLYEKQNVLIESLEKTTDFETEDEASSATFFKCLALFDVLRQQAWTSKNFNSLEEHKTYGGPFNLRKLYNEKIETARKVTSKALSDPDAKHLLFRYMPGARKTIKSLMNPQNPKKKEPDKKEETKTKEEEEEEKNKSQDG